jgi:hypothetical protein
VLEKPVVHHGDDGVGRGISGEEMFYYPTCYRLEVDAADLRLDIVASLPAQEILTILSPPGFWEGVVTRRGLDERRRDFGRRVRRAKRRQRGRHHGRVLRVGRPRNAPGDRPALVNARRPRDAGRSRWSSAGKKRN